MELCGVGGDGGGEEEMGSEMVGMVEGEGEHALLCVEGGGFCWGFSSNRCWPLLLVI